MKQKYDICAMKYRMLSDEELRALEPELKEFLIVNGLDGAAWEQLNTEHPDKAISLVELFSDIVLEKAYKKVEVLEKRDAANVTLIRVGQSAMEMFHVTIKKNVKVDLEAHVTIPRLLNQQSEALDVYHGKKAFQFSREEEVHRLIIQGFVSISSRAWEEIRGFMD
jgi:hypothetical protein